MRAGRFPRPTGEDPLLGDGLRLRLRESTGRPLPLRRAARQEERQLLATILGAAADRLVVSWQRADATGRTMTPSTFLREIEGAAGPVPPCVFPAHPRRWRVVPPFR